MTKEESVAKLASLRETAETLTKQYNEAVQTGNFETAGKADLEIANAVNEYTSVSRDACFDECKSTDDPMMAAVKMLTFTTIAAKDEKVSEDKIPVRTIVDKEKPIDLLKLDKYCGGIGSDEKWVYALQKMNMLLTAQKAVDLGLDPKAVNDSYSMSEIARELDMGKSPTSKTNLLKTLQTVVSAMIGDDYKATSHDVNFLMSVYSRKNRKALTVSCANHRSFCAYLAEICHRIVTEKSYELDYKTKKEA